MVRRLSTQYKDILGKGKEFTDTSRADSQTKVIQSDNSLAFVTVCEDLCTSTPHRSETSGVAERTVRKVKEGTSAELLQSGSDEKWWADPMACYCYLRNVQDLLSDGKTPSEWRFGEPFADGSVHNDVLQAEADGSRPSYQQTDAPEAPDDYFLEHFWEPHLSSSRSTKS